MLYSPNLWEAFLNLQESVMDNPTEDIIDSDTIDNATSEIISNWKWQSGEESFRNAQESPQCTSPESSFDAKCPSPEMSLRAFIDLPYWIQGQKPSKLKMSTQRRSKASEREKMRMRSLANALHELRDYLPVDYSQRAQPLTKIQTLKDTIKYINELSEILKKA